MEMNASKPPCGPVSRDSDARWRRLGGVLADHIQTRALGRLRLRTLQRSMVADHLIGIDKLETDLWKLADHLRAQLEPGFERILPDHHGPDLPPPRHTPVRHRP